MPPGLEEVFGFTEPSVYGNYRSRALRQYLRMYYTHALPARTVAVCAADFMTANDMIILTIGTVRHGLSMLSPATQLQSSATQWGDYSCRTSSNGANMITMASRWGYSTAHKEEVENDMIDFTRDMSQ